MVRFLGTLVFVFFFQLPDLAKAMDSMSESEESEHPRFGVWAGAGSGVMISDKKSMAFHPSAGFEIFVGEGRQLSFGYMAVFPISSEETTLKDGTQSNVLRMIHYFPVFRFFLVPDTLSFRVSPGISLQHSGTMMAGNNDRESSASTAVFAGLEYFFQVEPRLDIGVEGTYEYISKNSDSFSRVLVGAINLNVHYRFGGFGMHGHHK